MVASPRVANCVFCDDIRHEVGNKISLMGIYSKEMIFDTTFPAMLPKFTVAVWLITDIDDRPKKFTIRILVPPDKTEVVKIDQPLLPDSPPLEEDLTKFKIFSAIPFMSFIVPGGGFVEAWVDTERGSIRAGRLRVRSLIQNEMSTELDTSISSDSIFPPPPS